MSGKLHTNADGITSPCPAQIQCRLKDEYGNPVEHHDTHEEARAAYEERLAKAFGDTSAVSKSAVADDPVEASSAVNEIFDDYFVDEDDHYYSVFSNNGEASLMIVKDDLDDDLSDDATDEEKKEFIRKQIADNIADFDADEELSDYGTGRPGAYEYLRETQEFEHELKNIERTIRGVDPLPEQENTLEESPEIEELPDPEAPVSEDRIQDFIDATSTSGPNAEYDYDEGSGYSITLEGPDSGTVSFHVDEGESMDTVYRKADDALNDFSAEEEFDNLWNESFGDSNGFSAGQFADMLDRDENFFKQTKEKLRIKLG